MTKAINIVKLCVGASAVADLEAWQKSHRGVWPAGEARHITRMVPKRTDEVLNGSLYWVFKGQILARQKFIGLDTTVGSDGITRCVFRLDAKIIPTQATPRRAFQGWRYLEVADSPIDLPEARPNDDKLPPELEAALAEMGLR